MLRRIMAKNYLDRWEEEDEEFKPNERLAEVLDLVKKGKGWTGSPQLARRFNWGCRRGQAKGV